MISTDAPVGFKHTVAGLIPEDWSVKRIGEFLQFVSGKAHEPFVSSSGKYVVVNSKFISTDGRVRKYSTENLTPARVGDVLMVMSDLPNGRALAKCFLVDKDAYYAVNQRVCIFRTRSENARYLRYALNRNKYFMSFDDGAQQTHLLNDTIKNCPVILPIPDEQKLIADALTDAENLISSLEKLIRKRIAIRQGMRYELLTGKTRLPGFKGDWKSVQLGDHVSYLKTVPLSRAQLDNTSPLRCLHYGDIHTNEGVRLAAATAAMPRASAALASGAGRLAVGDLVFADASEDPSGVGKSVEIATVPHEGAIPGLHTIAARFNKDVLADGFKGYLQFIPEFRNSLLRLAAGTKVLATTRTYISSIRLQLPDTAEQAAIAQVLLEADAEIEVLNTRLVKAKLVKQGMMQELLTGRTRLLRKDLST